METKSKQAGKGEAGKSNGNKNISAPPKESGGPKGPEPTRYGDWEIAGKCVDF